MFHTLTGYSGFECHLSRLFNRTILHVEYRLCPEHPLPAAVDDAVALYQALLQHNISPSQLMIMGDSAGGGLSLLTIQALIARQIPVPPVFYPGFFLRGGEDLFSEGRGGKSIV